MKNVLVVLSVFILCLYAVAAQPTIIKRGTGEGQLKKWVSIPIEEDSYGQKHYIKMLMRADALCQAVKSAGKKMHCYQNWQSLPLPYVDALRSDEIELFADPANTQLIRITEKVLCVMFEVEKRKGNPLASLASCHDAWEEFVKQNRK